MAKKEEEAQPAFDFRSLNNRLRLLENRTSDLDQKTELIENNLLDYKKEINKEIQVINSELVEIKRGMSKINEDMEEVVKELKLRASREELDVIKKYLDLWNPVNFVSRKEVERIVEDKLEES